MSLAIFPAFPQVNAISIIVGTAYSEVSSFLIQRPVFGAVWQRAQIANSPKEVAESKEGKAAGASLITSIASSLLQSYGVGAILHLANVVNYKGAAIVGALLLAAQSGPQIIHNVFVAKQPLDVVASGIAVKVLDTVGLALALQAYNQNFGSEILSEINKFK